MTSTQASNTNNSDGLKPIHKWADKSGDFKRQPSIFRNTVPSEDFPAEADRYHLYVSYACPWAHRVLIVRKLKGLDSILPFTSVHWHMGEKGWRFSTSSDEPITGENVTRDPIHHSFTHLRELYFAQDPDYSGRFTVPVLFDKKANRIVNNESAEIIRMLYTAFDHLLPQNFRSINLLPENLAAEIEETNSWTYDDINNGVYKSGFATSQSAYETAVTKLFSSLDRAEAHLAKQQSAGKEFYFGDNITEADVRLFTTIIRFDPVYVQHFKCNLRDIRSGYPALHRWVRNLYWNHSAAFGTQEGKGREGEGTTVWEHIKKHYTKSHPQINPHGITPLGPVPDLLPMGDEVAAVEQRK